ncbi:5-oxoprolinase subunit PxpA [Thalassotalea agariperforans]
MKLNCDLGESFAAWQKGNDSQIMPLIDMANVACGFHAGDALIMSQTVALAKQHQVTIGAHPSYQDLAGFGRRSIKYAPDELIAIVQYQISALAGFCLSQQVPLTYVKPHGALYNDMMADLTIFDTICQAVSQYNIGNKTQPPLKLLIQALPNVEPYETLAEKYQIALLFEAFADRSYQDNGLLTPRSEKGAILEDVDDIVTRCQQLLTDKTLTSLNGKKLAMKVDTLCVHGDNQEAVAIVIALRQLLNKQNN